jgi:chromate transporter
MNESTPASPESQNTAAMSATPPTSALPKPPPSLSELFIAFATISLSGFGGVLAWSRRMMVEQRRWLTAEQFNEVYALCSFLPGPNIVNFSVVFGSRIRGPLGGLVALVGLLGPPMVLIIIIGAIYAHYGDIPALRRALTAVAAAAAGLIMATVAKMARAQFGNRALAGPLIALATCGAIGIVHWPLPLVLLAIVPLSIAATAMNWAR